MLKHGQMIRKKSYIQGQLISKPTGDCDYIVHRLSHADTLQSYISEHLLPTNHALYVYPLCPSSLVCRQWTLFCLALLFKRSQKKCLVQKDGYIPSETLSGYPQGILTVTMTEMVNTTVKSILRENEKI